MPDIAFPKALPEPVTAGWILQQVGEEPVAVVGSPDTEVISVAALEDAKAGSFVFCRGTSPGTVSRIAETKASVVVVEVAIPEDPERCFIQTDNPTTWFVRALKVLFPCRFSGEIHPTAIIAQDVELGKGVGVGPFSVVGRGVQIGESTQIGSNTFINSGTVIGNNGVIQSNCTIGGDGLAVSECEDGSWVDFPNLGKVLIGDDVRIGPNCCILRGPLKDTFIGSGTRIGNQVNIAHNCKIGENCWISAQVMLCGSVTLDRNVMVGASACINNHVRIHTGGQIGLGAVVTKHVPAYTSVFGVPAKSISKNTYFTNRYSNHQQSNYEAGKE